MFGIWIKDIINCIPQQYHCITQQWQTPAMHSSRRRYRTENIPSPATSYPSPSASSSILLTNLHWNTQLSRGCEMSQCFLCCEANFLLYQSAATHERKSPGEWGQSWCNFHSCPLLFDKFDILLLTNTFFYGFSYTFSPFRFLIFNFNNRKDH